MNLVQKLIEQTRSNPDKIIISQLLPKVANTARTFNQISHQEFLNATLSLANYLHSLGVKQGDNVAIISNTRPEWLISDFAIMFNGAASVSVYQTLTSQEIAYLLYDSGAQVVIVENQEQLDKLNSLINQEIHIPEVEDRPAKQIKLKFIKFICIEDVLATDLTTQLVSILAKQNLSIDNFELDSLSEESIASIVYTSGTTGLPKGVFQTHGNHLANISQVINSEILKSLPSLFLFLPLAHSFAKLMAYLGILANCSLKFPATPPNSSKFDPELLVQDLRDADANVFPIVPRILEKVEDKIKFRSRANTIAAKLLRLTIQASQKKASSPIFKLLYKLLKPIREKVKKGIFGANFLYAVSGGAKLNPETNNFFDQLGITILQGYGLTETCVATNINRLEKNKIGTVGPVLDSTIEIKIAEDQEILFRGPNITKGYWKRPQATAESWKADGWFHTGDLGFVDDEGYLAITGRKKEIIVTSYGKKIAPHPIEYKIKESIFIDNAVLFGNDRPYLVALLVVNKLAIQNYCKEHDISLKDNYLAQPEVVNRIQIEINHINAQLASYEAIKRFALIDEDFSIENGYLTPTMKVKVSKVYQGYQNLIDGLYGGE